MAVLVRLKTIGELDMPKTFLPTLAYTLNKLCLYITRYRIQIEESLAPLDVSALLDSVVEACQALRELCIHPEGE